MNALEDVDLAKVLSMLPKHLPYLALAITLEHDDAEQDLEMAEALEQVAELLRERARTRPPKIIETGNDLSEE